MMQALLYTPVPERKLFPLGAQAPGGLFAPAGRPKPLPMGEVALRSNDGEGKPLGEPFHLHDTAPLRWNKWRSSYK